MVTQPLVDLHNLRLEIGDENQLVLGYQFFKELCNRLELSRSNHNVTQAIARTL